MEERMQNEFKEGVNKVFDNLNKGKAWIKAKEEELGHKIVDYDKYGRIYFIDEKMNEIAPVEVQELFHWTNDKMNDVIKQDKIKQQMGLSKEDEEDEEFKQVLNELLK